MAEEMIAVKPARKGMGMSHPVVGPLRDEGGDWPNDQFTYRRLLDHDIKRLSEEEIEERAERRKAQEAEEVEAAKAAKRGPVPEDRPAPVVATDAPQPAPALSPVNPEPVPPGGAKPRPLRP